VTDPGLEAFWRQTGGDRRLFVDEAFAGVVSDYDLLVRLFSGGLDRRWRQTCVEAVEISREGWVLDCATGTDALALAADRRAGATARVVGADACGLRSVSIRGWALRTCAGLSRRWPDSLPGSTQPGPLPPICPG
jgi:hypothetical protein